jgi:CRP/FNR family transcriptional activator FtrB
MHGDDLARIRALPLFVGMNDARFEKLSGTAYFQRFPASVTLIREGEAADFLHVVVDGAVALAATDGRRETIMEIVRPIETFLLAAVVREQQHLMSARTIAPSRILLIPSRDVRAIFEMDAVFARAVVRELADRYRGLVKTLKGQKLRTAVERLANYLIRADAEQGGKGHFRLALEKRALASFLGMSPENLSRALATLSRHGVVVAGAEVRLTRPADLAALARPNPLIDGVDS